MIARIRSALLSVNASYWFYPALFSALAFFLSFFTIYLDRHGGSDWVSSYDWLHVSRPAGARTMAWWCTHRPREAARVSEWPLTPWYRGFRTTPWTMAWWCTVEAL